MPPAPVSRRCCPSSCMHSAPFWRDRVSDAAAPSDKARVGSLSRIGRASVMHCGNTAWVPPEHAMQLQCTTAARWERTAGLQGPEESCELPGANAEPWPTGSGAQRAPKRCRWDTPAPRTKQEAHLSRQATFGDGGCSPSLSLRQPPSG